MELNFCYLGKSKAGKTSIIRYLFDDCKRKDTLTLPETTERVTESYESGLLKINNTEIPGKYSSLNEPSLNNILVEQHAFIYVHDLKFNENQTNASQNQLQEFIKQIFNKNSQARLYIFFHQSDLDFLYHKSRVNESIKVFKKRFENYIKEQYDEWKIISERCYYKKTSIYDYSINNGKLNSNKRCHFQHLDKKTTKALSNVLKDHKLL